MTQLLHSLNPAPQRAWKRKSHPPLQIIPGRVLGLSTFASILTGLHGVMPFSIAVWNVLICVRNQIRCEATQACS